jgi:hypothetical protein
MHGLAWNYIALFIAGAVLVWTGLNALRDNAKRQRDAFDRAVPGLARVLKVATSTPSRSYGTILMDVLIQVHRSGVQPYELSTIWSVEPGAVAKMQAGQTFSIKVDPLNPGKIYSGETWARSLGLMKNRIELSGD